MRELWKDVLSTVAAVSAIGCFCYVAYETYVQRKLFERDLERKRRLDEFLHGYDPTKRNE
jgi:hypothetical protein